MKPTSIDILDSLIEIDHELYGLCGCMQLMLPETREEENYQSAALFHIFRQLERIESTLEKSIDDLEQELKKEHASA